MTALILWGSGIGLGLWSLAVWLIPPRRPLTDLLTRLDAAPIPPPVLTDQDEHEGIAARLGHPFVGTLGRLGLPRHSTRADLTVTGQSPDTYLAEKAALALTGLFLPSALSMVLLLAGRSLPWQLPAAISLLCAAVGFVLPDLSLHHEAERRRADFRHALSAYLNLVHILLAGGAGVDGALTDAAGVGRGWAFQHLRTALNTARLTRSSPWTVLGRLGDELGVPELAELAASLTLAGTEGARVRTSLAAKAAALRSRSGADAEARANAATERMVLPGVLMAAGFVLFVFYPALQQITATL